MPEKIDGSGFFIAELVLAVMKLSRTVMAARERIGTNTGIGSEALVADSTEDKDVGSCLASG